MGFLPRLKSAQVQQFMTPSPLTISVSATMERAHELMRQHKIRHLPVTDNDKIVGVISLRDLHLLETLKDVDAATVPVADAMSPDPRRVVPTASLREVADTMMADRIGSVLVTEGNELLGIFTTTDALAALSQLVPR